MTHPEQENLSQFASALIDAWFGDRTSCEARMRPDIMRHDGRGRITGVIEVKCFNTRRIPTRAQQRSRIPRRFVNRGRSRRVRRAAQSRRTSTSGRDGPPSGESDPPGLAQARREQHLGAPEVMTTREGGDES